MLFTWLIFKLKAFLLHFINIFRRALCCFRRRKLSYSDSEQLTHVVSNDLDNEPSTWTEWNTETFKDKPRTVQDYIEQYREQTIKARTEKPEENSKDEDLFESMTPQIKAPRKVLVSTENDQTHQLKNNRLSVMSENSLAVGELGEWDESSGWDGERLLDEDAQKVLREQKRLEREKKALAQHQKRMEKTSRTLGNKLYV
ncbi:receptor-binding cancer antigen expressed on SiSo cells [Euwallacea fornicatus]|uniref:receptor-binding cancer antigen expressed on SiSo cells n=1 Tax=Euwallacea fornicatus TaxID=995702 RepID=UPI00338FAAD2